MRPIILVLIAMMALGGLLAAASGETAKPVLLDKPATQAEPAETAMVMTPSLAAFLNDSWVPSSYNPDYFTAEASKKSFNGTILNTTYSFYDFLTNDTYKGPSATSPIYSAVAPNKNNEVVWTGESIYQFLDPTWTPETPILVYRTGEYTKHQMS
ncbi:MAG: hypothetical protein QUS08_06670 [Methanothrix sp.]|nr:hypothetical protein [Methanothrix sp.]